MQAYRTTVRRIGQVNYILSILEFAVAAHRKGIGCITNLNGGSIHNRSLGQRKGCLRIYAAYLRHSLLLYRYLELFALAAGNAAGIAKG